MNQCPTTSGPYRCKKTEGHTDDCEADEHTPLRFGPYRDRQRAEAYLRGVLDASAGSALGALGVRLGVPRRRDEDECAYRERVWRSKR